MTQRRKGEILYVIQCPSIVTTLHRLQHVIPQFLGLFVVFQSNQDLDTIRIHDSQYAIVVFE